MMMVCDVRQYKQKVPKTKASTPVKYREKSAPPRDKKNIICAKYLFLKKILVTATKNKNEYPSTPIKATGMLKIVEYKL